jgi:ABC-type sugar transport system substrate-binding protein
MEGKIGVFVLNDRDDYHGMIAREAEIEARRHGIEIEVHSADDTAAKQARDVVHFALDNPGRRLCALVVPTADSAMESNLEEDAMCRLARRVLQRGSGWITLNHGDERLVPLLRAEFPALPVGMVVVDNVEFGRIQGRQLRALLPKGGAALCVCGRPLDSASRGRSAGLKEELAGTGITIEEVDGRWEGSIAGPIVHKWVTSHMHRERELHAVVCQNDEMAIAVRRSLQQAADELGRPALKNVPILGGDGLPTRGRKWVDDGTLTATVCATLPGGPAVALVARHWKDESPLPPVTRLAPASHPDLAALRSARG